MGSEIFWGFAGTIGTLWLVVETVEAGMRIYRRRKESRRRRRRQKIRLNYCRRYYGEPIHIAIEYGRECTGRKQPIRKATRLFSDAAAQKLLSK